MAEMANTLYEAVTGNRIVKAFTMEDEKTASSAKSHSGSFD